VLDNADHPASHEAIERRQRAVVDIQMLASRCTRLSPRFSIRAWPRGWTWWSP